MASEGSVTQWLAQLKGGDEAAVERLWQHFVARLESAGRHRLKGVARGERDEQDLAQSAFFSFYQAIAMGRYPELADRNQLWAILLGFLRRKACDYARREKVRAHEDLPDDVARQAHTPEFAAIMAEEYHRLLGKLGEGALQSIALLKMEGLTDKEIATHLDCGLRTVERKLERIRRIWEAEISQRLSEKGTGPLRSD